MKTTKPRFVVSIITPVYSRIKIGLFLLLICQLLLLPNISAQNDIIEDLNPANFNPDFSNYDQKTAIFCGRMSDMVYKDTSTLRNIANQYNKANPSSTVACLFIKNSVKLEDIQLMVWAAPSYVIIIIKGTYSLRNAYTDISFLEFGFVSDSAKAKYYSLPNGHAGFRRSVMKLMDQQKMMPRIRDFLSDIYLKEGSTYKSLSDIPIYVTGHSMGAAIGSMMAMPLRRNSLFVQGMYLFAPPLAISCTEREIHKNYFGKTTHNIVNYKDYVPRAGLRGTLSHFGHFYRICNDLILREEPERYVPMNRWERTKIIEYHSMPNHLRLLRDIRNSENNVLDRFKNKEDCMACEVIIDPCDSADREHPCKQ